MAFPCKKFDITLPTNGGTSYMICGASRSGKTCLMKHIYNTYYKKHITMMFSMNPQADIYKNFDKNIIVSDKFHPELIEEARHLNVKCDNKYPFLIISDDYVDSTIKGNPEITRCMTIGRNAGLSSVWSFQGRTLINPVGRAQVNFICIFKQNTNREWKNVVEEFLENWLPIEMTMAEKIAFCVEATKDYQFFFIDQIVGECYLTKLSKSQI